MNTAIHDSHIHGVGLSMAKITLKPWSDSIDGLITAKKHQKVVSHETANVVRVEDELQPRCSRGRTWGKIGTASDAEESFELLKTLARGQARMTHVVRTCNTCETHVIIVFRQ